MIAFLGARNDITTRWRERYGGDSTTRRALAWNPQGRTRLTGRATGGAGTRSGSPATHPLRRPKPPEPAEPRASGLLGNLFDLPEDFQLAPQSTPGPENGPGRAVQARRSAGRGPGSGGAR